MERSSKNLQTIITKFYPQLRKLYLNGNCFSALPASLGRLRRLQDLGLNGVPWCKTRQNQLLSRKHFEEMLDRENLSRWLDQNDRVGEGVLAGVWGGHRTSAAG